ncbi:hypothetical protein FHS48_000620 [Novispirillum itersonii]|uniref:Uncharacterized protein n=1 Tax=Novispirillum itersonii TaxID=189 RepID=A0A7X0DLJ6_NOVIT|nr:hypothetical protein [Novispirillum itersonii]
MFRTRSRSSARPPMRSMRRSVLRAVVWTETAWRR